MNPVILTPSGSRLSFAQFRGANESRHRGTKAESPDPSGDPLNLLQVMLAKGATRVADTFFLLPAAPGAVIRGDGL